MRGRPPKPTALKILQGNPGRRPLNKREPEPTLGKPEKPEGLGPYGEEIWDELIEQLIMMQVMSTADRRALELCARSYQEYRQALTQTDKKISVTAASDAWKRCKSMLVEFGLTPSSRSRVKVVKASTPDPLEKFLAKGRKMANKKTFFDVDWEK